MILSIRKSIWPIHKAALPVALSALDMSACADAAREQRFRAFGDPGAMC